MEPSMNQSLSAERMLLAPSEAYTRLNVVSKEWRAVSAARPNRASEITEHLEAAIAICRRVSERHGATLGQLRELERLASAIREALS